MKWKLSLVVILLFIIKGLQANHVMGGEITYQLIDTNTGKYRFTIRLYRSCSGIPNFINDSLDIRKNGFYGRVKMTLIEKIEVTPLCLPPDVLTKALTNCTPLQIGIKGVERHTYQVEYTIGKNIGWAYVGYKESLRNNEITTGQASQTFYIQSGMNTNYQNNSPIFNTEPVPYWCKNIENTYNHGAIDTFDPKHLEVNGVKVDRDILNYELICPFASEHPNISEAAKLNNICTPYNTGYDKLNFLKTINGVFFNPISGDIRFAPNNSNQDGVMAVAAIEYRAVPNPNGVGYYRERVGYVTRDIQFTVHDACDPITPIGVLKDSLINSNYISSTEVDVCGKGEAKIVFKITAPAYKLLKTKVFQTPSNQNVYNYKYRQMSIQEGSGESLYGTITFDSSKGIGQDKFTIQVYYCTTFGFKVSRYYTLIINYKEAVKTNKLLYYCVGGKPVRAFVSGATKYEWRSDSAIFKLSPDGSWADLAPKSSKYFLVKGIEGIDSTTACTVIDSVRVIVIPKFSYSLSPKNSDLCLLDTIQVQITTPISDTPYKYRWQDPTMGSIFSNLNKRINSIPNPKLIALQNAKYPLEIENKFGCILMDTVTINLKGVRPNASAFSARAMVCPGDTTKLGVSVVPSFCGPSIYNSLSGLISKTMTTAVSAQFPTTNVPTYPSIFNTNSVGKSSSHRIIYTKAQLTAIGIKPGILKSISFGFVSYSPTNFDSFEIRLGSTLNADARLDLRTFSVFKQLNHTPSPSLGWVKYNFNRGFDWDGKSNLVVEVYAAKSQTQISAIQMMCSGDIVAGNQLAYKFADNLGESAEVSSKVYIGAGATATKPLIRLEYSLVDSSDVNLLKAVWSPSHRVVNLVNPSAIATPSSIDTVFIAKVGTDFCFDTAEVKIGIDQSLKVDITNSNQIICRINKVNPTINLSATINSSPVAKIQWKQIDASGLSTIISNSASTTINPSVGVWKYVIVVSDSPCMVSDTVSITIQDTLPISLAADMPLCTSASGRLKAILPAGTSASQYKFFWSPTATNDMTSDSLTNLVPNTYALTIKLKADETCQGTTTAILTAINQILVTSIDAIPIKCKSQFSDSLTAYVSPYNSTYKFQWNTAVKDSFQSIYNKMAQLTNYVITVTDTKTGCQGQSAYLLTEPSDLKIDILTLKHVTCKGLSNGNLKISASGGNTANGSINYLWTSVEKNQALQSFDEQSNLLADSLYLVVTDAMGCTINRGFRILEPNLRLKIDTVMVTHATTVGGCNGSAIANISGGTPNYTYEWSLPIKTTSTSLLSDNYTNLCKGIYQLNLTDNNGCKDSRTFQVNDLKCHWTANLQKVNINCNGAKTGSIEVNIQELKNPTTTDYTFSLIQSSTTLSTQTQPYISALQSAIFPNLYAGIYDIQVKTNLGCDTILQNILLTENPRLTASYKIISPSCKGYNDGEISVKSTDAFLPLNYDFGIGFRPDSNYKNLSASHGKVFQIKNALGCIEKFYYDMEDPKGISVSVKIDNPSCYGSSDGKMAIHILPLNPNFPYQYVDKPGTNPDATDVLSNISTNIAAGDYRIKLLYANDAGKYCEEPLQISVIQPSKMIVDLIKVDSVSCPGYSDGKIDISLMGGSISNQKLYEYSIDGGLNFQSSNKFIGLKSAIYNMVGRDNLNCIVSRKVAVESPESLFIQAYADTPTIQAGGQTKLSFVTSTQSGNLHTINSILWTPNASLSCSDCSVPVASPYNSTLYHLELRYHKNCLTQSKVQVNVIGNGNLFVPSAFTPGNKDGLNDYLMVYGFGIKSLKFIVFNRWGLKVFEGDQLSKGWDGFYKGELQMNDVYSYFAEVEYLNGTKQSKKGSATLIR